MAASLCSICLTPCDLDKKSPSISNKKFSRFSNRIFNLLNSPIFYFWRILFFIHTEIRSPRKFAHLNFGIHKKGYLILFYLAFHNKYHIYQIYFMSIAILIHWEGEKELASVCGVMVQNPGKCTFSDLEKK